MSAPLQSKLPFRRGFFSFFVTQLLSAFNDNFWKSAAVVWIGAERAHALNVSSDVMIALCSGLFILPFFLFSGIAGELADRYEKPRLIRYIKLAEVAIMAVGALGLARGELWLSLAALFLLGVHSTFLGPIKYAIVPQLVPDDDLVVANGLVVMSTFLAILAGAIAGVLLAGEPGGLTTTGVAALAVAALGYLVSLRLPELAAVAPELSVQRNPFTAAVDVLRVARKTRAVFLSVLGISWFWLFGAAFLIALPGYVRTVLAADEPGVAVCLAMSCAGIALGALVCDKLSGKNLELGLVPLGSIGMTLVTLDLFLAGMHAPHPLRPLTTFAQLLQAEHGPRILLDLFAIALFGGIYIVPLYTLIMQRTIPAERSRVVAANNIVNALFMVAASLLLAGLFEAGVPAPHLFLVLALLNAAVAIYIYALLPEFLLRFIAWILSRVMYRSTLIGHERVPEQGGVVVVSNHVSFVDFLIIAGSIRRPVRFVMDYRIAATPVVSLIFKQGKTIPIAPERENRELMEQAFVRIAEELRAGEVVCIFPEGKLTANGEMNPFRPGIERIIAETPVPVVPMALDGLWGSMFSRKDRGARRMVPQRFRARLSLVIGDPVPPEQVTAADLERRVRALLSP